VKNTGSLLVVDPTDISKPYAEKMQYLARVKHGSAGQLRDGYWCCQVVVARRGSSEVQILYSRPGGIGPPHFDSKDDNVLLLPLTL
jgi:hypothetical protein